MNTCKEHFVISGLEEDPVEFGLVIFKAFVVEHSIAFLPCGDIVLNSAVDVMYEPSCGLVFSLFLR
ncbi:hypothetical protein STEG23_035532, partial [Scotinomys teguina]